MIAHFYSPPSNRQGLWPQSLGLVAVGTLPYYNEAYPENETGVLAAIALPPDFRYLTAKAQAMLRIGLTLTLTELPDITQVLFWVAGEGNKPSHDIHDWLPYPQYWDNQAVRVETFQTVANNPVISPGVMRARIITLYFVSEDGQSLVTEVFFDDYVDQQRLAEEKVMHLLDGPLVEGAVGLIPPETRVRMVNLDRATFSVYVDFSSDFESRFTGSPQLAHRMLQSIVNTLTAPDNNIFTVNQVFFLIDSQRVSTFHGVRGFDQAFVYDHPLQLVYEEAYPSPYPTPYDEVPVGPRGDDDE